MPVDKRIFVNSGGGARKGGMDKDTDPRYVQNGFYTNARNISYMVNGNNFVVTNLKGNTSKSYTLNAGDNICIGAYDDKGLETVYYFIWNGNGDHEVVSYGYNLSDGAFTQLAEGVGLGFMFNELITGIVLVLDRYLVWTQEDQEIGCIDLENLPATTITTANRALVELYKIPNPTPLEPNFFSSSSIKKNNLVGKLYKFRTRYVYKGGFRTHPSRISKLTHPQYEELKQEAQTFSDSFYYDNAITIPVELPDSDQVEKVELLVQSGVDDNTMGIWYKFRELTYDEIDLNQTDRVAIVYTGDEPLEAVDQTEMAMPFSFIPPRAKEVVFLPSNVLAFLNITEGFDADVEVAGQTLPIYNTRSSGSSSTITFNGTSILTAGSYYNPNFDILINTSPNFKTLTVDSGLQYGYTFGINLNLLVSGSIPVTPASQVVSITARARKGETQSSFAQFIADQINSVDTRYLGFGGIVAYAVGSVVRLIYGVNQQVSPYTPTTGITSVGIGLIGIDNTTVSEPNFKRYREHFFALQYNKNGRRSSAIPLDSFYSEGFDTTTNDGSVSARVIIENTPPTDADSYDILYAKNAPELLQIFCNAYYVTTVSYSEGDGVLPLIGQQVEGAGGAVGVVVGYGTVQDLPNSDLSGATQGTLLIGVVSGEFIDGDISHNGLHPAGTWTAEITISLAFVNNDLYAVDIFSVNDFNIKEFGSKAQQYNYVDGDLIRPIAKYVPTDAVTTDPPPASPTAGVFTYFNSAPLVKINEVNVNFALFNFDLSTLTPSIPKTSSGVILTEVVRPTSNTKPVVYSEIGHHYNITGGYHTGNTQTQNAVRGAIIDITDAGDTWSRLTPALGIVTYTGGSIVDDTEHMITEANDFSPYYDSAVTAIGRPNVVTESGLDQIQRGAAIAFTQPIVPQSTTNGLSIVLGSSIKTYDDSFGSIQKASLRQNKQLIVYFEDKVGQIGILEELAKQDSSEITYQTTALLNGINYYEYDGGIGTNPEGFAKYNETHYFPSSRNNAICRLSSNGIQEISDYGMTTWFNENLDVKDVYAADRKILGVYDERLQNYTVSIMGYAQATGLGGASSNLSFTLKNAFSGNLADLVEGIVLFDGTDYYYQTGLSITVNSDDNATIVLEVGANTITAAWLRYRIDTPMFNEPSNSWVSFSDITPDYMVTTGVDFSSFKDGGLWVHNTNNAYGSLYGVAKNAEITMPFNAAPDKQKRLQTIELEANSVWTSETDGDINIEDGNQTSQLFENYYSEYQPNEWAAGFRQDTLTPNRTNALLEGYDLRGKYGTIRLLSDATTQAKLASMGVQFFISESSL